MRAATTTISEISGCCAPSSAGLSFQNPLCAPTLICKLYPEAEELGAEPARRAQEPARASIGQNQMVAGGRIGVVQIARELPEQIAPIFVEGLRLAGDLDDVFPVAANVADGDEPNALLGPPFELIANDIVLVELLEKPDVSPSDEVAERGMDQIGLGVRQDVDLAKGDLADGRELLHEPRGIVPALLDNSDQPQRIEGAERMARRLGFNLVLPGRDICVGRGRLDDFVIGQDVRFDDLGEDLRVQAAEEGRDLVEQRFHSLCRGGVDRVADFLLTSAS